MLLRVQARWREEAEGGRDWGGGRDRGGARHERSGRRRGGRYDNDGKDETAPWREASGHEELASAETGQEKRIANWGGQFRARPRTVHGAARPPSRHEKIVTPRPPVTGSRRARGQLHRPAGPRSICTRRKSTSAAWSKKGSGVSGATSDAGPWTRAAL